MSDTHQPSQPREANLLTVKEYADQVRQHEKTIYRRISEGRQDGVVRVGGAIRLKPPGRGA